MSDLAPYIRDRVASTTPDNLAAALTAVLDQCELIAADYVRDTQPGIGERVAAQFEQTIARALGITD